MLVAHTISTIVSNRAILQNCRQLPPGARDVISETSGDSEENFFLQYDSNVGERYGYKDDRPFYLMDASGLCPGRYLIINCGYGRAFTNHKVCQCI